MATVAALGEVASGLLELHGQHQHRALVQANSAALDAFGGVDRGPLDEARSRLRALQEEATALGGDARQRAREAEILAYQIEEIEVAAIEDGGEDERLEAEEERLAAADAHREAAAAALAALRGADDDGAVDRLAAAAGALAGRPALAPQEARVLASMAELGDLAGDLRTVLETWEDDPERLEAVRARRHRFHELGRKYGDDLDAVLAFADDARVLPAVARRAGRARRRPRRRGRSGGRRTRRRRAGGCRSAP